MSYNFSYENIWEYCTTMWGVFLEFFTSCFQKFFREWGIIILYSNEKKEKKSMSKKTPGRAVIKDWQFYLVWKMKFSIFIHSLKNNLFGYRWVGIILSVWQKILEIGPENEHHT